MGKYELEPNSHKYKREQAEKKKVERVVQGNAKIKKKSELGKFTDMFVSEDARNVKEYVFADILIPAVKKLVADIVTDGIDMILYGESGHRKKSSNTNASYVSYRQYSDRDRRDDRRHSDSSRTRHRYNYNDVNVPTRGEAEEVLTRMDEILATYGAVTVGDLYELVGIEGNGYTDHKYGWTDLRNAEAVRSRDGGYDIRLPRAVPLD